MPSYVGKCKTRGCRTALHVTDEAATYRSAGSTLKFVGTGAEAAEPRVAYVVGNYGAYARCADHGLFPLRQVRGRVVESIKCGARCLTATGPNCDCACGGANHGAGHS